MATSEHRAAEEREPEDRAAHRDFSQDKAAQVICWGELLWDLYPEGALLGGAPSNVAVHLARLHCPTALITSLGRDELGARAREELAATGVDMQGVQEHAQLPTGRVGIVVHEGEARYTLHDGAWREIACNETARALLASSRALVFGTLSQESPPGLASFRQALASLGTHAITVCDPNLRGGRLDPDLVREHMRAARVVKINDAELVAMERVYGLADGIAWLLEDMQVQLLAHTKGHQGAVLYTRDASASHPGFAAHPGGDNVGAGDAFTAVLTLAAMRGTPLPRAVEAANRLGSFVASQRGATPLLPAPLRDEVDALLGPAG